MSRPLRIVVTAAVALFVVGVALIGVYRLTEEDEPGPCDKGTAARVMYESSGEKC